MNRNYLPSSLIVLITGVALILIPQSIEMNITPEIVTVWEDTITAENSMGKFLYQFNTGDQVISDQPTYFEVWSDNIVRLNTTLTLLEDGITIVSMNITDNPALFYIPNEDTVQVQITGTVIENQEAKVNAGLYTLRPVDPEKFTYYPFRFFGYGMTTIGVLASLVFYVRREN